MKLYGSLVVLRIVWTLMPQTGYIHPDEFFQTVEVVAGDAFNITVEKTWEFQGPNPIRSIVINKILFAPVFTLLRYISEDLNIFTLTGHIVLFASRAVMLCLSFTLDYQIWRICKFWNLNASHGLVLLSSSYVMLTYQTHSFSNSIETGLLLFVFATIAKCSQDQRTDTFKERQKEDNVSAIAKPRNSSFNQAGVTRLCNSTDDKDCKDIADIVIESKTEVKDVHKSGYNLRNRKVDVSNTDLQENLKGTVEKHDEKTKGDASRHTDGNTERNKMGSPLVYSGSSKQTRKKFDITMYDCILLALLNTLGIFNRPTFALFSICPFIWWCNCMRKDFIFLVRCVSQFSLFSLCFTLIVCSIDTCYYRNLSFIEIFNFKFFSIDNLIFAPINFVTYNTKTSNLESHGRHPFYLHFLVNFPLLFGPIAVIILINILSNVKEICVKVLKFLSSRNSRSLRKSVLSNVLITHEQLLLMCIVLPIILLSIFPHQEPRFLIPLLPFVILYAMDKPKVFSQQLISIYIIFNIVLGILYGVVHQGGIIPCMFKIQTLSRTSEISQFNTTFMFSHTYMPPRHLLLLKPESNIGVIDLQGANSSVIQQNVMKIKQQWSLLGNYSNSLYLVLPGTVLQNIMSELKTISNVTITEQFYWHFSMEDPPNLSWTDFGTFMDQMSLFSVKLT